MARSWPRTKNEELADKYEELEAKYEELAAKLAAKDEELDLTLESLNVSDAARAHDVSHCEQFKHEYSEDPVGCAPCGSRKCMLHDKQYDKVHGEVYAAVLKTASHFTSASSVTNQTYYMRHKLNCKSRFVIYLVTCNRPGCGEQYVGKTAQTMYVRHMAGHKKEIKEESTPLGRHFHSCKYENFELQIIDCYKTSPGEQAEHEAKGGQDCPCKVWQTLVSWEKQWNRELKPAINS